LHHNHTPSPLAGFTTHIRFKEETNKMTVASNLIELIQSNAYDLEGLVALRIEAMRESLERVGRFDPVRARERFAASFSPQHTHHVVAANARVGFVVVKPQADHLLLDHLYIQPGTQSQGLGAAVLARVFLQADQAALPLRVGALRESASNRFYLRHGFVLVEEADFDNYYVRPCKSAHQPV
jgi:GNAT superfamily N-acetyltransferase